MQHHTLPSLAIENLREHAYRIARRQLSAHDAEDVAQDNALAILRAEVIPDCPVAYAGRAARNATVGVIRRRATKLGQALAFFSEVSDLPAPTEPEPFRTLDVREVIRAAEAELDANAVVALALVLECYTQGQIGKALGISRQAVQRLIAKALPVLRRHAERLLAEKC